LQELLQERELGDRSEDYALILKPLNGDEEWISADLEAGMVEVCLKCRPFSFRRRGWGDEVFFLPL